MPDYSRKADQSLQDILTTAGGLNPYGEPKFRLVWGWSRLTKVGGKWFDYDKHGVLLREVIEVRDFPKYHPSNDYWYVEKWCSADFYGLRWKWDRIKHETQEGSFTCEEMLGPYPERGEYECSWRVSLTLCRVHVDRSNCLPKCINTEYFEALEPTHTMMEEYVRRVLLSEVHSDYERFNAIKREQEREEKERDRVRTDILTDDNQLYTGSYVAVPKHFDAALSEWQDEKGKVN